MRPTFDLQSHSIHSDGALPAAEVVRLAAADGVELFALSDHDTADGLDEAFAEAERHPGLRLVSAVEISSVQDEHEDLHVLGYGVDHTDAALLERLAAFRADRDGRAGRMADALRELGWEIDESTLDARRAAGKPIGRPHLAQAVFGHPANAARIADEGLEDFSALLVAYLIPGAPAFRRRTFPGVQEAIDTIHAAGGLAIWAHPFWDLDHDDEVLATIDRFAELGPGRGRGVLRHAHRAPDAARRRPLRRARAHHHRIVGLPRPRAPPLPPLPRARAPRPHA